MQHLREHKNQTNTEMKQRWGLDSKKQLKCWSKRKPTVGLRWTRPEPEHQAPTYLNSIGRRGYRVRGPTRRRPTQERSKVINRDWVNCHACSLSYSSYIYVISNLYKSKNDFTKLSAKMSTNRSSGFEIDIFNSLKTVYIMFKLDKKKNKKQKTLDLFQSISKKRWVS